jgi:hypothetical protein
VRRGQRTAHRGARARGVGWEGRGRLLRGAYAGLPRHEVLRQDIPQDALYRLHQGRIERLDCAAVA